MEPAELFNGRIVNFQGVVIICSYKAAKEVLTQDEKAYVDRLTQALTYNFLYAQ